jgi:hypothetical protein
LANALAKGISKELTKKEVADKKMEVRFNEEAFRNTALKVFEDTEKKDTEKPKDTEKQPTENE